MAQHDNAVLARRVFAVQKNATLGRLRAKSLEKTDGSTRTGHSLRLAVAREVQVGLYASAEIFYGAGLTLEVEKIGGRHTVEGLAVGFLRADYRDNAIQIGQFQRTEKQNVGQAV